VRLEFLVQRLATAFRRIWTLLIVFMTYFYNFDNLWCLGCDLMTIQSLGELQPFLFDELIDDVSNLMFRTSLANWTPVFDHDEQKVLSEASRHVLETQFPVWMDFDSCTKIDVFLCRGVGNGGRDGLNRRPY